MKYFILDKNKHVIEINDYLKRLNIDPHFANFIRREALNEQANNQNEKPEYLDCANKLGFNWDQNAELGQVQYNYKANLMRQLVQNYARQLVQEIGMPIYEVNGANMFNLNHPVVDKYASLFGDRLYQFKSGKSDVVMSYDASYPQFNIAANSQLSYKQLPFAHFSLSDCYRHEQSGELMMLMRQRRFYMPDVHPYFRGIDQAFEWFPKIQAKILEVGREAGREYHVVIEIPSEKVWQQYKKHIEQIAIWLGRDVLVNVIDDKQERYWVVNVDYKIIDSLGQSREIGCIQVDIHNAKRLNINYIDENGARKNPIIIHSAIPGGIERYLYVIFDKFKDGIPFWAHPSQIRLLPVSANHVFFCKDLVKKYNHLPLRIEIDDRNISVGAKLKSAHDNFVPHKIVIGDKEVIDNFVELEKLIEDLSAKMINKPFIHRSWPAEVSSQI